MAESTKDFYAAGLAETVQTGYPPVQLMACSTCGALLWDVKAHYETLHPVELAAAPTLEGSAD